MAVAPSQTRIVNRALVLLGTRQRITSITDGSPLASLALATWDDIRDEVTAEHPWNHAVWRAVLAASVTPPAFGYDFAYELPEDNLRWLPPAPGDEFHFKGEQEGDFIMSCQEAPLYIRYIRRVEDLSKWSIGFRNVISCRMAMELCEAASGGMEGLAQRVTAMYTDALSRAKRQDGLATGDRRGRVEYDTSWTRARGGYDGACGYGPWSGETDGV